MPECAAANLASRVLGLSLRRLSGDFRAMRFTRRPLSGSMMTHPGVYCLRSNETGWDEATLWRTYFTLDRNRRPTSRRCSAH